MFAFSLEYMQKKTYIELRKYNTSKHLYIISIFYDR